MSVPLLSTKAASPAASRPSAVLPAIRTHRSRSARRSCCATGRPDCVGSLVAPTT